MWHYGIWNQSLLTSVGVVHSTWPSGGVAYACTNIQQVASEVEDEWMNKKVTLHILTHGAIRGYGLTSSVVCINDKILDIGESNAKVRSDVWTIHSLGFRDIREWVILWRVDITEFKVYLYNECRVCLSKCNVATYQFTHTSILPTYIVIHIYLLWAFGCHIKVKLKIKQEVPWKYTILFRGYTILFSGYTMLCGSHDSLARLFLNIR